jgi:hypothetical protein
MSQKIRLTITNASLPEYKFQDDFTEYSDVMISVTRTMLIHKDSSKLSIIIEMV